MKTSQGIIHFVWPFHRWLNIIALLCFSSLSRLQAAEVQIRVNDENSKQLPCRIHLIDSSSKAHRPSQYPFWKDHFVCDGIADLDVSAGEYSIEIERGPAYQHISKSLTVNENSPTKLSFILKRIADPAATGWYSGDLHVHRSVEEIELLMAAEDLHIAPVITWWNNRNLWANKQVPNTTLINFDTNRFYDVMAGEDEREGGALLYYHLQEPIEITGSSREYPSPMKFLAAARQYPQTWIDIEKPFWWDAPIWLASSQVDSIGIANNHMCRSQMYESEAWGRPRDTARLPAPLGNGLWTQEIYYHILNCGIRIPPSAGSASGVLPNPVGYNRVFVSVDGPLTWKKWWAGLKAGRSFVTNGPILYCKANRKHPGHIFTSRDGKKLPIEIDASLISNDSISKLEVIKNGKVIQTISTNSAVPGKSYQATINFEKSGWFLVRAITDQKRTFRFASTAPWYVEVGPNQKRISQSSAKFFLDWVDERAKRVPLKLEDPEKLAEVLRYHKEARKFWQGRFVKANSE